MRLGAKLVALVVGLSASVGALADDLGLVPVWSVAGAPQWTRHGADVFTVGGRLAVLDAASGAERHGTQVTKPSGQAELLPRPATDGTLVVFGWYVWDRKEGVVVCYDARTLQPRWQRRFPWGEGASEIRPQVHAAFAGDGVYVQLTGRKDEENLLKLNRDTGDIIWAQQLDRWVTGVPPVWFQGKLLVRSAVEIYRPNGHGHYQAIEPSTGMPVWRIRLESMPIAGIDEAPLLVSDLAHMTTRFPGAGRYGHFYIVDIQRGRLIENTIVEDLQSPFAYVDRVVYFTGFPGRTPGAARAAYRLGDVLWRGTITPSDGLLPSVTSTGVADEATKRVYVGDTARGIWVLSMVDGKLLGLIDTRKGYVDANPLRGFTVTYGAARLERDGDRVFVGTQDGRLIVYRLGGP